MQNPTSDAIAAKFIILRPLLDERARRAWAAVEARAMGRGGMSRVAEATGLSRVTIRAGLQELARADTGSGPEAPPQSERRRSAGRRPGPGSAAARSRPHPPTETRAGPRGQVRR